ncbi:MAG: SDR family NAD(P)-dependent oxidoreductase [Solirubrobacteraceae bacterium]
MSTFALRGAGAVADRVVQALGEVGWEPAEQPTGTDLVVVVADAADPVAFEELDERRWRAILDARLRPAVEACIAAVHDMAERGSGCIVLIAVESEDGPGAHVAAADGGLEGLTKALAAEVAAAGIRVNMIRTLAEDADATAETVRYLARDGTYTTGQVLRPRPLDVARGSGRLEVSAPPSTQDRLALVTGSTQGIGRATASRLAAEGARVAINGPDATTVAAVAAADGGIAAPADISAAAEVDRMVAQLEAAEGPVGLLVANAAYMSMGPLGEHDATDWWRNLDVNLTGHFNVLRAVMPGMRRRGGGHIVMIASEFGVTGSPNATGYAASKAGVAALVTALAVELAPHGITIAAIAPGVTDTAQLEVDAEDAGVSLDAIRERFAKGIPMLRIGRPEEIAATVAFLAGPAATAYSGQLVQPNGGATRARP